MVDDASVVGSHAEILKNRNEPRHKKAKILHICEKQRRRSAAR